ncbi:MAG: DNA polymerase/3'-5' exonuclease PolX [Chloroflexi bacterium]|nr:DNA polymerase/3'-5' exonuclease PolX [Chloroflexota bacterium]
MDNSDIARVFSDIATLLQLKGEAVFKTRAYQRAAEIAAEYPGELSAIADDLDELKSIPGIGDALAKKIQELSGSGRLEYYEDLKSEFPAGLLTLLEVPGIGPKTALRASEQLDIHSVEGLEAAIEAGEFEKLPRVGHKNAQSILRHIRSQRRQSDRIMLGLALPAAEEISGRLAEACPDASNITVAGSSRRMKESVGDIDLLCTSDDPPAVTKAFAALDDVIDVLGQGDTKASVVLKSGLQVDLRVTESRYFGALLLYFTGSKQHGINLRARAQSMGLSLNEYGLTSDSSSDSTGELETFDTEAGVYERLGLPFIPPELREDHGEIEAAEDGLLPDLLTGPDIKGDLHVHSDWSDGRVPIKEMVVAARELGLEYVAITDHSAGRGVANGLSVERLRAHNAEIERVEAEVVGIRVLKGSEVDIRADGTLDYTDEVLSELDIVIASVHSAMGQERAVMTERVIAAMRNPHVTAIGHLTTRLVFDGVRSREPVDLDLDAVFRAAADTGTLLEINASPKRLDLRDAHVMQARKAGVLFLIDTDAHRPSGLSFMRYGVGTARRGWCEARDVVNTMDARAFDEFLALPKERRTGKIAVRT